jgi:hypothetical protein
MDMVTMEKLGYEDFVSFGHNLPKNWLFLMQQVLYEVYFESHAVHPGLLNCTGFHTSFIARWIRPKLG